MKKSDLFFPLLSVFFGGSYWIASLSYPGQSAFFPRAVIVVLFIFSIIYVIKESLKKRSGAGTAEDSKKSVREAIRTAGFRRALILCSAIFLYWLLSRPLGFILTNVVILLGLMKFLGARWSRAILLTLLMTVVLHFFFREYLHVPFPRGPGEWFYYWLKHSFF